VLAAVLFGLAVSQVSWAESPPNPNPTTRYPVVVYRPADLSTSAPAPLVVLLHGGRATPQSIVSWSRFDQLANQQGFVVAALSSGINQTWLSAEWMNSEADVNYISSQITSLEKSQNIDPSRVFVVGFSSGGSMAYRVGCELAPQVAGIGIVSAVFAMPHCSPSRPVTVMGIFGTADVVPFNGSATAEAPAASIARWRKFDSCPTTNAVNGSGVVSTQTWQGCAGGTAIDYTVIQGGKHTWSGVAGLPSSSPNAQLNATSALWGFLSLHPRSAAGTTKLSASVRSLAMTRAGKATTLVVRLTLGEPAKGVETLSRNGRTVVSRKVDVKQSGSVSLVTHIPRALQPGRYAVRLSLTATAGVRSFARTLSVRLR
jgi:polyhydroxybutyrate depolymerase